MNQDDIQEKKKLIKQKLLEIEKSVEAFTLELFSGEATDEELAEAKKMLKEFMLHQDIVKNHYKKNCKETVNPAVVVWLAWLTLISEMLKTMEDTGFYE